jgi:hypothetical protein
MHNPSLARERATVYYRAYIRRCKVQSNNITRRSYDSRTVPFEGNVNTFVGGYKRLDFIFRNPMFARVADEWPNRSASSSEMPEFLTSERMTICRNQLIVRDRRFPVDTHLHFLSWIVINSAKAHLKTTSKIRCSVIEIVDHYPFSNFDVFHVDLDICLFAFLHPTQPDHARRLQQRLLGTKHLELS